MTIRHRNLNEAFSEARKQLAVNVIARRQILRMSQAELADRSGVAASHVCMLEKGRTNPTLEVLIKLAQTLGCPMVSLFAADHV